MKKALSLILALVMCLSLCACGGGNDTPKTKPDEKITTPTESQLPTTNSTETMRPEFKEAMDEVYTRGDWMHFFPEGSMWFHYPDIRPLKKAVFKYAVNYDRPILPITFSFRPRTGLWKLLGKDPLVDLNIGDPLFHDKELPKLAAIKKMQQDAYHIMQGMNGIHPGDPTYHTDQDPQNYKKTM